jgi:hypothetical protein
MKSVVPDFRAAFLALAVLLLMALQPACLENQEDRNDGGHLGPRAIVVNSLDDLAAPPAGVMTLRQAIAEVEAGGRIVFDRSLNGGVILLSIVGEAHSILPGETYAAGVFAGYHDRDYGPSAIYAVKDLTIDASSLPDGIAIRWDGGLSHARVLAVYGDLAMTRVTITSGYAFSEATGDPLQPYTLARGGALAVWGTATLDRCVLSGNRTDGDVNASRDRGSFGGGIYGNVILLRDCVVSGNWVRGYGAAGGGVYSVGGADFGDPDSEFSRCAISGNRITAQHAYGGGVFSEGGGPGNGKTLHLRNCTIARNLAEDNPAIDQTSPTPPPPQYYYRGGGFYMTNGSVEVVSCTIVENQVTGVPAIFSGKPNMGGGGIAATIGNAHVVEDMAIRHSIVAGNLVNGIADDLFSGSLLNFYSYGYNLFGKVNFDYILVPIPPWWSLSRKHYPKKGDQDGVDVAQAVDLAGAVTHPDILSVGPDAGANAVLWYPPAAAALDRIPDSPYAPAFVLAQYQVRPGAPDNFLAQALEMVRDKYGFGPGFGAGLDYVGVTWQGDPGTWPSDPLNAKWIKFWRDLDVEIGGSIGAVKLGDDFWGSITKDEWGDNILFEVSRKRTTVRLIGSDQLLHPRPESGKGDIGAIEGH